MSTKIHKLEIENVKRVKAVTIEPTQNGLTVIGGRNGQGKTSILDAIAWAVGGSKFKPSDPQRRDSVLPPNLKITMNNGLTVERKGKNSDLKVTDPTGEKAGQKLLDSFVEEFSLNIPKFMNMNNGEKAKTLLRIIGAEAELAEYDQKENQLYNERRTIGRIADQKKKYADEMKYFPDAPKEPVLATEIIHEQQKILLKNAENQKFRETLESNRKTLISTEDEIKVLSLKLDELKKKRDEVQTAVKQGEKTVSQLKDESTEELENSLKNIEAINLQVRANLSKDKAEEDAKEYSDQYKGLSDEIEKIRNARQELLSNADLPLPELSVTDGELSYKGMKWDGMSGAQQLKVATAIVRKLNPECGFVLLDKLEQMDTETMNEFGKWLEAEGLQAIATRVSTGEECQIIIEDGYAVKNETLTKDPEKIDEIKPNTFNPNVSF